MNPVSSSRMTRAGLAVAGLMVGCVACVPTPGPGPVLPTASPAVASNGICPDLTPYMPTSTGSHTPTGVKLQMAGAVLAPVSHSGTLKSAYTQFNNMTCTFYSHKYTETPPRFFYYDCVGFTGYAVKKGDPVAWGSVQTVLHIGNGFVPTPYQFEGFLNGLKTAAQPGWQAVANIQAVRAGDIFAWQPMSNGAVNQTAVGHSVMPLVKPVAIAGSNGTRWEVVVMDSTAGGHGPQDTRKPASLFSQRNAPLKTASGVQASGLGIGTIALDTTTSGQVTGVEWNVGNAPESIQFGAGRALS
jgi:hypothetical protein